MSAISLENTYELPYTVVYILVKTEPQTMDNWEVKQLRLTIFPTEGEIDPNTIWENMVGEKPEVTNTLTKLRQVNMQGA